MCRREVLAGGVDAVKSAIQQAQNDQDYQWALQLVDRLINADIDADGARQKKAALLRQHAVSQINCPTRHYYIQSAKELEGG